MGEKNGRKQESSGTVKDSEKKKKILISALKMLTILF